MFRSRGAVLIGLVALLAPAVAAAKLGEHLRLEATKGNPIKKVVTLLKDMQKEIEGEGEKEKELFEKFMCYCKNSGGGMEKAIADAKTKVEELAHKLDASKAEKLQTEQELTGHKMDRESAQKDLGEATAARDKEAKEFDASSGDLKANIDSVGKAITTLEKSTGASAASLVQVPRVMRLRRLIPKLPFTSSSARKDFVSFLDQSGDYVPASDQIVGMLKAMNDDMQSTLAEESKAEESAASTFAALDSSKKQEIQFASDAIEAKMSRAGELAVEVVETADMLQDAEEEVTETIKFQNELKSSCGTKEKEFQEREQMRADEISAVGDAISTLTDDDAQEAFKKSKATGFEQLDAGIDAPAPVFLQRSVVTATGGKAARRKAAVEAVEAAARRAAGRRPGSPVALLEFQLRTGLRASMRSKEAGFEGVIKVVAGMKEVLTKEQAADKKQKEWCDSELEKSETEQQAGKDKLAQLEAASEELQDQIKTLGDQIDSTTAEVAEMDKNAAESTEQRKSDHEEYVELLTQTNAAIMLMGKAKNRLNKFYNPTIYVKEEEGLVQTGHRHGHRHRHRVAPPPPPETPSGPYEKNSKSTGIIALMDSIITDLEKDKQEAEFNEKEAQKDYVEEMNETAAARAKSAEMITRMKSDKAGMEEQKAVMKEDLNTADDELDETKMMLANLHGQCDKFLKDFEAKEQTRAEDIEGLSTAQATLEGA